jgi:hypothetical protein
MRLFEAMAWVGDRPVGGGRRMLSREGAKVEARRLVDTLVGAFPEVYVTVGVYGEVGAEVIIRSSGEEVCYDEILF